LGFAQPARVNATIGGAPVVELLELLSAD